MLGEVQLIVSGIAAGIDPAMGEVAVNMQRLYEFVGHCVLQGSRADLRSALDILLTLREAFQAIRGQAVDLERTAQIPPLQHTGLVQLVV